MPESMHLGVRPGLLTLCLRFFSLYYFSPGKKAISFSDSQRIRRNIKISRFEEEGEGSCRCFCHFLCVLITQNQTSQALGSKSEAKRGSRGGKGSRNTSEVRCSRKPAGKKERTLLNS